MEIKRRERCNIIIFDIVGDFQKSTENIDALHQLVKDQLNAGKRNFLINLEDVDNIDYFGVGELLASLISVNNLGGKLKFVPFKFWLEHNLKIGYGIWVYENEDKAIKSFSE